jgi:hypothetical protein
MELIASQVQRSMPIIVPDTLYIKTFRLAKFATLHLHDYLGMLATEWEIIQDI